jgi:DNA repair exonuclease SbcCD ATPase subunit
MEPICFLCQEYEVDIGHQTILCPKQFCKKCHQAGHFAMNCNIFCKAFVTKDEQLVKVENNDVTKTESYKDALPCKIETKMENWISVRKDLIKIEDQNCDGFSKSEEKALMFCLESMPPKEIKKRKIDSKFPVEKALPLEEVQQKIIEKLSNDLVNLNEEHQSEIKDLRQRLSKNALIVEKQWKEVETLRESKKKMEIKFRRSSTKIIEQLSNDILDLTERKRKMEKQHQNVINDLNQKLSRNALIIEKQRKELEKLCKGRKKMEVEFEVLEDTMTWSVLATPLV